MTYSEMIAELYSEDLTRILNIINKSIYASQIDKNEKGILVVHTGFVFNTHKNTTIELLFDFYKGRVIRQPRNENYSSNVPLINGLWLKGDNNYFGLFYSLIIHQIWEGVEEEVNYSEIINPYQYFQKSPIIEIEVKDHDEKFIKSVIVFGKDGSIEYPFQKKLAEVLYYDGNSFRRNITLHEYRNGIKSEDSNYEDWLREEYGDDAETAYWNNE